MKTVWRSIGRGLAGWHASGIGEYGKVSGSGGTLAGYLEDATEGAYVYDARNTEANLFTRFVLSGPIDDATLPPGTVQRFEDREAMAAMMPGLDGGFEAIAASVLRDDRPFGFGSVDYVAPDVYEALLREYIPGVRFGRVWDGAVTWEGEV